MKNLFGKKSLAIALSLAMVLGTVGVYEFTNVGKNKVKANEINDATYEELLPTMEKLAEEYSEAFAENQLDKNIEVKDTTPIYDVGKNIVGYSVGLVDGDTPYGYVNVDYTSDGLVTDFTLQEDTESMYDSLVESYSEADASVEKDDFTNKLYDTPSIDYAVSTESKGGEVFYYNAKTYESEDFNEMLDHYAEHYLEYYDNIEYEDNFYQGPADNNTGQGKVKAFFMKWLKKLAPKKYNKFFGKVEPTDEPTVEPTEDPYVEPTPYPKHSDVFIYEEETMGQLDEPVMLDVYSPEKSLISQRTIMTTTNRYACALVAVTEIVQQEDMMLDNDLKKTFDKLWDIGGCQANIYETSTFYGSYVVDCSSTYSNDLGRILREYGKLVGKDVRGVYKRNVGFNAFKESIDGQHSTTLGYQIKNEGGHGVNVVGYSQGKIGDHELNYLIAANGWHDDAPRYVLYDRDLFASTGITSFTIKDMK